MHNDRTVNSRLWLISLVVVLAVAQTVSGTSQAPVGLVYSTQGQLLADAQAAPCANEDRFEAVRTLFLRNGAAATDLQVVEAGKFRNIVLTLKGSEPGFIVVGAHYDKTKVGCGAVDNWTGVTLLAHVYRTLRQLRPRRTFVFVAFGGEEEGLKGSRSMVDAIPKADRKAYCAMVNFDSFGMARPQSLTNISTQKLTDFAGEVAGQCKVPFATAALPGADSDSSSFKRVGIPAITLHGLGNDWDKVIHTNSDQTDRISAVSLYLGYVLGLNILGQLDNSDCARFR